MPEKIDLFNLEKRLLALEQDKDYLIDTLKEISKLEKKMDKKYDEICGYFIGECAKETAFDKLKREKQMGIAHNIGIIERATEILKGNPYESYTPIELLIHIYRLLQGDFYGIAAHKGKLVKDLDVYLRYYQTKKKKWGEIKPDKGQGRTSKYIRIFEDDHIALHISDTELRFITKKDSSAYDVPLKLMQFIGAIEIHKPCEQCEYSKYEELSEPCPNCKRAPSLKDHWKKREEKE